MTIPTCHLGCQSLNPKSLMNGIWEFLPLGIWISAFLLLYSKTRRTRKITMIGNRYLIDKCPGRQGWEWLSKKTNNYNRYTMSSNLNEKWLFPASIRFLSRPLVKLDPLTNSALFRLCWNQSAMFSSSNNLLFWLISQIMVKINFKSIARYTYNL